MFKLKITPKYNGIGSRQPNPKPEGTVMSRLKEKLQFQHEVIDPALGELAPLYRHHCDIFISGKCVGQGYGSYGGSNDDYDTVGNLLKTI